MNLFTDIDGVLIGKSTTSTDCTVANYAKEYLEFCLQHFNCYWLTTHCKGSIDTVIDYLTPFSDHNLLLLAKEIQPTNFHTFKTEALFGDFIWIDDQPTAYEIQFLSDNNLLTCWLEVNTYKNINDLKNVMDYIQNNII